MHVWDVPLQDALRRHLLPLLNPKQLDRLQALCRTLQELVDNRTLGTWRDAAQTIIPLQSLPISPDGHAVQTRLRVHAATLTKLMRGILSCERQQCLSLPLGHLEHLIGKLFAHFECQAGLVVMVCIFS